MYFLILLFRVDLQHNNWVVTVVGGFLERKNIFLLVYDRS